MGWEVTAAVVAYSALSAGQQMEAGQSQAKADVQQAQNQAVNSARDTARTAGTLRSSFLSSGLTLDGGPAAAIAQAFDIGNQNIKNIAENGNAKSSNAINSARTQALTTLARSATVAAGTSSMSIFGTPASFNGLGQSVGSWFDSSPVGPYQPFGV